MRASPGTLRLVFGHDNDGDPRFDIYDDEGKHVFGTYTMRFLCLGEWRNRRRGRRHLRRLCKWHGHWEEMVVDHAKYDLRRADKDGLTNGSRPC